MKETELRDSRIKNGPQQTIEKVPKTVSLIPSDEQKELNINLLNFLVETTKLVDDNYDSRYALVTEEDIIVMDQQYGRNVSLEDGIKRPELVAPRTKNRFTFERVLRGEDMAYYWYRVFVYITDYANSIPQFRMLSIEDQCQLFRHNFGFIVWVAYSHHYKNIDMTNGWPIGNGAYLPIDGLPDYGPKRPEIPNTQNIMSRFESLLSDPWKELEVDMHELCFIKTILLFQFEENLSSQGREICVQMQNRLLDSLYDYQIIRFPEWTNAMRSRRQSKILLLLPRISQVMHLEHDIQLVLSVFGTINLDGIPHELLFYNSK
uniref:NR LBD domain-containing protein n=1 Tax=Acrobeloides nanus TaxID=290746 RepID=A0A914DI87_9BILA